jgi:hypothetical protein
MDTLGGWILLADDILADDILADDILADDILADEILVDGGIPDAREAARCFALRRGRFVVLAPLSF